jgi:hypothetical protein
MEGNYNLNTYLLAGFILCASCTSPSETTDSIERKGNDKTLKNWFRETVELDGLTVLFELTDAATISSIYPDFQRRNELTKGIGNSREAAVVIETYLKNKFAHIFSANDSVLSIHMLDGSSLNFPKWDEQEERGYHFDFYFEDYGLVLLFVQHYEGSSYALINRQTGQITEICGLPRFPPHGKGFVAGNVDIVAGYSFNGLELYEFRESGIERQYSIETGNWGPVELAWLSDSTLIIRAEYWTSDMEQVIDDTGYLKMSILRNQ